MNANYNLKLKRIIKPFIFGVMLTFFGCTNDFLDISNPNELDANTFIRSVDELDLVLTGAYSSLKSFELYGSEFLPKALYGLAKTADQDFIGQNPWNQIYQNQMTADNGLVRDFWRGWYRMVSRTNDFLENARNFKDQNQLTDADAARLDRMIGEAHFLRGLAYFHIIRLWGEDTPANNQHALGVPLITTVANSRDVMHVKRAGVGEVYEQIVSDFKDAEIILPEAWPTSDIARPTKYTAKGYLGKVYLYLNDLQNSKEYFEAVINSEKFSLVPFERYDDLFHGTNEFSEESLFEINFSEDLQEDTWAGGLGSNIALIIAPKGTGWSNLYPHDESIKRFGNDPRLRINALEPLVDSVVDGSGIKKPLQKFVADPGALGWSFRKYVPLNNSVYSTNRNYGANILMMRLADVYLMYAEALNGVGEDGKASEYMNKVRRRAYGFEPDAPQAQVDYVGLNGVQLRDSIREERFRELFAEGHRWYDLQRWRIAAEDLAMYQRVRSGNILFEPPKSYYLPIPQLELEANQLMEPSTGY